MVISKCIKKYQNISKNFKNCQAWQTHRAGSLSRRGAALSLQRLVLEAGPPPLPSWEDTQNPETVRMSRQATVRTAPPGLGTAI